ncbi:MAG: hypothetical protein ACI33M_09780 [Lysinibacillus sp.]
MNESYDKNYPELKKDDRYTSPASSLPLHELKMLQEYIHNTNLQNLSTLRPNYRQQMILIKFFKSKKNQLVEVYSRNGEEVIHTVGKVSVVGKNFVILRTLFKRFWIPYTVIHSTKSPFGIPDVPGTHQHTVIDEELRRKLLTNFGVTVAGKEALKQQFFEELLETNLKSWKGTKLKIFSDQVIVGKISDIHSGKVFLRENRSILINKINYIQQFRFTSFFEKLFSKWFTKK